MSDLAGLADQATPVLNSLSRSAPALAKQYEELAPFAGVARKSLIALGSAAQQQEPALIATIPLAKRLLRLGNAGVPSFTSLDKLTSSLDRTGAIEDLMTLLFNGTNAVNGFDSAGHYIRTEALVGSCTGYAKITVPGCSANFTHQTTHEAADVTPPAVEPKVAQLIHAAHAAGLQHTSTETLGGLMRYLIGPSG